MMSERESRILKHIEAVQVQIESLRVRVERSNDELLDFYSDVYRRVFRLEVAQVPDYFPVMSRVGRR